MASDVLFVRNLDADREFRILVSRRAKLHFLQVAGPETGRICVGNISCQHILALGQPRHTAAQSSEHGTVCQVHFNDREN